MWIPGAPGEGTGAFLATLTTFGAGLAVGYALCWRRFDQRILSLNDDRMRQLAGSVTSSAPASEIVCPRSPESDRGKKPLNGRVANGNVASRATADHGASVEAATTERYKMVLVVRKDLKMGTGKMAAQCSHATVAMFKRLLKRRDPALQRWEGTGAVKVTVGAEDDQELLAINQAAKALAIPTQVVVDAGRTQVAPNTRTVLAVGPAPVALVNQVTSHLRLL